MHTNSIHARMRRAVERETMDMETTVGNNINNSNNSTVRRIQQQQQQQRLKRKQPRFNPCLALIVLSPLAILGAFIGVSKHYKRWIEADAAAAAAVVSVAAVEPEQYRLAHEEIEEEKKKTQLVDLDASRSNNHQRIRGGNTANSHAHNTEHKNGITKEQREPQIVIGGDQKAHNNNNNNNNNSSSSNNNNNNNNRPKFLVLETTHGNIKITLRPDLSKESVDYVYELVQSYGGNGHRCNHCNFYRSQQEGILQGVMEHKGVVPTNTVRGTCPLGAEHVANDCPKWDSHCGCHGPVMTHGSVAWAAGQAGGPDFFIDGYSKPATWWGTQHTNFGFVEDGASLDIIDGIFRLPTKSANGMSLLLEPIHFDLILLDDE